MAPTPPLSPDHAPPPAAGSSATLKSAHVWEVSSPPPIGPGGAGRHRFLPSGLTPGRVRRRRISVEVHRSIALFGGSAAPGESSPPGAEICYVRILRPGEAGAGRARRGPLVAGKLRGGGGSNNNDDEEDSVSDGGSVMRSLRDQSFGGPVGGDERPCDGWVPKYKAPLRTFHVVERKKRHAIVAFETKGHRAHREFVFEDESALADFIGVVEKNKSLMAGRANARLEAATRGLTPREGEELALLFDICSGTDLPRADVGRESDAYVSVRFEGRKVHRTGHVSHDANPIWTLRKGSLFIWKVDALELFRSEEGLVFEVKDYDAVGSNDSLGAFNVSPRTLYEWDGERREFALKPLLGERDYGRGKVALRARRATEHDFEFLKTFSWKRAAHFKTLPKVGTTLKSIMAVHARKEREGPDKGKMKYLVRPGPDPARPEETAWLTKERIEEESMGESREWIEYGSGSLGRVFVEVIGCDGLPNLDKAGVLGDKTDAFVSLVYEDAFARTDVIADCLKPRWMPWTRRAFIFNMFHTSSQLFLAVFDSDLNSVSTHDFAGRVSIDISNFRRNTVYLLRYNLYLSAKRGPRERKYGTIMIRLRMDLEDDRTLLLSNFKSPEKVYVNVEQKKDLKVIQRTVEGSIDMKRYSLGTINACCEELISYLAICYAMEDAFKSLILWRSHSIVALPIPSYSTCSIKWVNSKLPLHSMVAFICTVKLVENPDLFPSFFFGCIGWILVVTSERRSKLNTNPWAQTKSFGHFLSALILGKTVMGPHVIGPNANLNSITAEGFWETRVRDAQERAKKRAEEYARQHDQYLKELEEIGHTDEDLSTQKAGVHLVPDPARAYLFPIQQYLQVICVWLRIFKNVLSWEECYISFWIAVFSFILSLVAFFIPWGFLLKWTLRVVVWVALGPWMKLADIYYFSQLNKETDEQKKTRMSLLRLKRQMRVDKKKLKVQIAREKASKLRDFKQYMFGELMCNVNILKQDRYYDFPLPSSSAAVYHPKSKSLGEVALDEAGHHRTRVDGQQLVGEMIPKIYETPTIEAPTGKPTKRTNLLEKGSPGAFYDGDDSYSAAATKVGSIVVGAGAITWFGVPLFLHLLRLVLPK